MIRVTLDSHLIFCSIDFLSEAALLSMLGEEVGVLVFVDLMPFNRLCALKFRRSSSMSSSRIYDDQFH